MSTYARYLIAGPFALAPQARAAARQWDASADTMYQRASLYMLGGGDPAVATHACSYGRINVDYAPAIQAALAEYFPGWQMIQHDDPSAALAQAGLGRVQTQLPS